MKQLIGKKYYNIIVILFFIGICCRTIQAEESKTVYIGYYNTEGFMNFDRTGNIAGYNADYLKRISLLTGWEYEYVQVDNFSQGLDLIEKHEIDFLAPAIMTDARKEKYAFSEESFGTQYTVLVTNTDNTDYYYEDYEHFNGMNVAVVKDCPMTEFFIQYMEDNNFDVTLLYCDTPEQTIDLLESGQAQAAVSSLMNVKNKYKILARFAPTPFYYVTWQGNDDLLETLNKAMKNLKNSYPSMLEEMKESYFPIYNQQYFTREEAEYIENSDKLHVAYMQGVLPISFKDEKDGNLRGISREIFDKIQKISGLQFKYIELPYGSITYEYLLKNEIDIISGVAYNTINQNAKGMRLSNPYLSTQKVLVGKKELSFDKTHNYRIAVISGSQTIAAVIHEKYPNFEIVSYETVEKCFEAVSDGDVDLLLQNQYVVDNQLTSPRYEDLKVIPIEGLGDELCFSTVVSMYGMDAFEDEESRMLINILNKTISQISQEEIENIIVKETMAYQYQYRLSDFLYRYKGVISLFVMFVLFGMSVLLYIILLKRKNIHLHQKEEEKIRLQKKRYEMIFDHSEEMLYEISLQDDEAGFISEKTKQKFGWNMPTYVENLDAEKLTQILHIHPDDKEKFFEAAKYFLEEKVPHEIQVRIKSIEGSQSRYLWCKLTGLPLMNEKNELTSIVGKIVDIDREVKEKDKLKKKSKTDGLTGLMNKWTFIEETKKYLATHSAKNVSIFFIDLDYFKSVNDTFGHSVGDIAITQAGDKLKELFANFGFVARFGGDEFCGLMKDVKKDVLIQKLEEAVKIMQETYKDDTNSIQITASIGAVYSKTDQAEYQELLDIADKAVYYVKNHGKNAYLIKDFEEKEAETEDDGKDGE